MTFPAGNTTSSTAPSSGRRVGKKAAGRLLDGREWSEFPQVATTNNQPSTITVQ
jgi:hypothetical protein